MLPSTCANPHLDWNSLPPTFIGEFARVLKRMRRWKSDGPSLRLLNRHWSHHISENVLEVRPHHNRTVDPEKDTASLLKFPRLTSVDISRFLDDSPSLFFALQVETRGTPTRSELHANNLRKVVDVLVQLPCLSQIEVSSWTVILCHFYAGGAKEQWSKLSTVSSVFVYHFKNPRLYVEVPFSMCWAWQVSHSGKDLGCLKHVTSGFRGLKKLEVYADTLWPLTDLTFLSGIESVKLQQAKSVEWLSCVSCRLAVASLDLQNPSADDINASAMAKDLESLRISAWFASPLLGDKLSAVFRGLRVLILQNTATESCFIADTFFRFVGRLEGLHLRGFEFNGGAVAGNLHHLRSLSVERCRLRDLDLSFLFEASELRSLTWEAHAEGPDADLPSPVVANLPPKLESLSMGAFIDDAILASIVERTSLEVLSIAVDRKMKLQRLKELEKLPDLRILRIDFCMNISQEQLLALLSFDFFPRLDQLWIQQSHVDSHVMDEILANVQAKAPRLLIERQYNKYPFLGRELPYGPAQWI